MLYRYELHENYNTKGESSLYQMGVAIVPKHAEGVDVRIRFTEIETFVSYVWEWYQIQKGHGYEFDSCMVAESVRGEEVRGAILHHFYPTLHKAGLASVHPVIMGNDPNPLPATSERQAPVRLSKEDWLKQNYPELSELPKWRFPGLAG
jgi:hypothetical protein